jgi:membrane-associated protein
MIEFFTEFFSKLHHLDELIRWGGYTALTLIVFAETGLLVGFFLPGDSLLVTAGLVSALDGTLNIWVLTALLIAAAIIGDTVGYWIGYHLGPRLFNKEDSLLFHKDHITKTRNFYDKHGPKTIVLARFVPIVRTFAPTIAGVAKMDYKKFVTYNVFGGVLWVGSMLHGGYWLGRLIPNIEKHIHIVILVVIFVSLIPIFNEWRVSRAHKSKSERVS